MLHLIPLINRWIMWSWRKKKTSWKQRESEFVWAPGRPASSCWSGERCWATCVNSSGTMSWLKGKYLSAKDAARLSPFLAHVRFSGQTERSVFGECRCLFPPIFLKTFGEPLFPWGFNSQEGGPRLFKLFLIVFLSVWPHYTLNSLILNQMTDPNINKHKFSFRWVY